MRTLSQNSRRLGYTRANAGEPWANKQASELARAGVAEDCVYVDNFLGPRRALSRLMNEANPGDILIVSSLDQLGLSVDDILGRLREILAKGLLLSCLKEKIDGTKPSGRLTLKTLASLPDLSRVLAGERKCLTALRKASPRRSSGRPGCMTAELLARAGDLLETGMNIGAVAGHLGVGRSTLYKAFQEKRA